MRTSECVASPSPTASRISAAESEANLGWLETGALYTCSSTFEKFRRGSTYRFEAFSSDPLGDTRQYLFRDVSSDELIAEELRADMPTPLWSEFLELTPEF